MTGPAEAEAPAPRPASRPDDWGLPESWLRRTIGLRSGERAHLDGSSTSRCFVLSGWLARSRVLDDGRRQIIELMLPGEHESLDQARRTDEAVTAIGECEIALISLATIQAGLETSTALRGRFAITEQRRRAILEEALVRLGRRDAFARTANLLCELAMRQPNGGLSTSYDCPITQTDMADILGLSVVHTNRSLQRLKREGVAVLTSKRMIVDDFDALSSTGGFRPARPS